jgi:hypothetical protein
LAAGKFVEICHNGEECFTAQELTSQLLTRIKDDNFLVSSLQYQESRIGEIQSYIIMHIIGQMINEFSHFTENITLNYTPDQSSSLMEFLQQFTTWFEYQWDFELSERNALEYLSNDVVTLKNSLRSL